MNQIHREEYTSDNGKYKILIRAFEGDLSPEVSCFGVIKGRNQPISRSMLPNYLHDQLDFMIFVADKK